MFAIGISLLGGCAGTRIDVSMWGLQASPALPSGVMTAASESNAAPRSGRVRLAGAANETLDFQFGIQAGGFPLVGTALRCSPIQDSAGRTVGSITLYRMHRVRLDRFPGWHVRSIPPERRIAEPWDVLVPVEAPRGGLPARLRPKEMVYVWADVFIPREAKEGVYQGSIDLLVSGRPAAAISVELHVLPLTLPDAPAIPVLADVDHLRLFQSESPEADAAAYAGRDALQRGLRQTDLRETIELLEGHGLTPVLPALAPAVRVNAGGRADIDWHDYDATVASIRERPSESTKQKPGLWPLPSDVVLRAPRGSGSELSSSHAALLRDYFRQTALHFEKAGWLERSYAMLPPVEEISVTSLESIRRLGALVRSADRRIPTAIRFWPQDMEPYGWLDYPRTEGNDAGNHGWNVDIWVTPAQFFDPDAMATQRAEGRQTWLMPDQPPFSGSLSVYAPPTYARVLPWQAERLGAEVLYLGCVNAWPPKSSRKGKDSLCTSVDPQACVRADPTVLLYPGQPFGLPGPVPSVRLKRLRQGIRDTRYLAALKMYGLDYVGQAVGRALASYAGTSAYHTHFQDGRPIGWVDDPSLFDLARTIMAEAWLRSGAAGRTAGGRGTKKTVRAADPTESTANWRRFMLATSEVGLSVDGVRLRLDGSSAALPVRFDRNSRKPAGPGPDRMANLQITTTIVNRTRLPIHGSIDFAELPSTWLAGSSPVSFGPVLPGESVRVRLNAQDVVAFGERDGVTTIPIELKGDDGRVVRRDARFALLTATPYKVHGPLGLPSGRLAGAPTRPDPSEPGGTERKSGSAAPRPVRIDGDLSDWPPGRGNVAGDFRLISADLRTRDHDSIRQDPVGPAERSARPRHATTVLVMRDDEALYFAVNCEFDGEHGKIVSRHNRVVYEDLVPTGEELVEILLDPLNAGTRSPTDLYYIAVKPSGAYLQRKGIEFQPPCGSSRVWPAEIEVATGVSSDRWTAELRVPLDSFSEATRHRSVWGLNVTRYDGMNQEFATWSGATGNAYDPLSLGNLYLP